MVVLSDLTYAHYLDEYLLKEKSILITVKALVFTPRSEYRTTNTSSGPQQHSCKQPKVLIRMEPQSFASAPPSSHSQSPPIRFCSGLKRFIASSRCWRCFPIDPASGALLRGQGVTAMLNFYQAHCRIIQTAQASFGTWGWRQRATESHTLPPDPRRDEVSPSL